MQRPMLRSHSVPDLIKDGSINQIESLGGVFRIIPTTPKGAQRTPTTLNVNAATDSGKLLSSK